MRVTREPYRLATSKRKSNRQISHQIHPNLLAKTTNQIFNVSVRDPWGNHHHRAIPIQKHCRYQPIRQHSPLQINLE